MKIDNKKIIRLPLLIIAIIVIIILIVNATKKEKTPVADTNSTNEIQEGVLIEKEEIPEGIKYKSLEISNIVVEISDGMVRVKADMRNATDNVLKEQWMDINLLDKDGNIVTTVTGYADELQPREATALNSSTPTKEGDNDICSIQFAELTKQPEPTNQLETIYQ